MNPYQKEIFLKNRRAKLLAKTLGYLPLALVQASAYIHQKRVRISAYLELYKAHEMKLLADKTFPASDERLLPVAITWDVTLAAIAEAQRKDPRNTLDLSIGFSTIPLVRMCRKPNDT